MFRQQRIEFNSVMGEGGVREEGRRRGDWTVYLCDRERGSERKCMQLSVIHLLESGEETTAQRETQDKKNKVLRSVSQLRLFSSSPFIFATKRTELQIFHFAPSALRGDIPISLSCSGGRFSVRENWENLQAPKLCIRRLSGNLNASDRESGALLCCVCERNGWGFLRRWRRRWPQEDSTTIGVLWEKAPGRGGGGGRVVLGKSILPASLSPSGTHP